VSGSKMTMSAALEVSLRLGAVYDAPGLQSIEAEPDSLRRHLLPVQRRHRALLMGHESLAGSLVFSGV